jgi:glycosyltransferase involved in cell wall biosynthesis
VTADVSVVIPNHNYGRFVVDAVRSVLAQTDVDGRVEVVVVDNGSTDDSLERLATIGDPRVRIVSQTNRGQAGARNRGILESTAPLLAFLDADDLWEPGKLAPQLALLERPEIGLVYCGLRLVDVDDRPTGEVSTPRHRGRVLDAFARNPAEAIVLGGESTAVVRRTVLAETNLYEPSLSIAAGWDLWRRVAARTEVDFVDAPLVRYRQHGTNAHRDLVRYGTDLRLAVRRQYDDPTSTGLTRSRRSAMLGVELMLAKSHLAQRELRHAGIEVLRMAGTLVTGG